MMRKIIAWGFVAGAVVFLLGMSAWQFQRLEWKEGMIAQYKQARAMKPVPIEILEPITAEDEYRRVTLTGLWLADTELDLGGRRRMGQTGYELLTPLRTASGKTYLINRGWVPMELKDPAKRPDDEALSGDPVTLTGMIRLPREAHLFTPENHPEKNFWFTVDIPAMEVATGMTFEPYTIEIQGKLNDPKHRKFPVPAESDVVFRNDHLGYALTWAMLAVAAAIVGWLRLRKPAKA